MDLQNRDRCFRETSTCKEFLQAPDHEIRPDIQLKKMPPVFQQALCCRAYLEISKGKEALMA